MSRCPARGRSSPARRPSDDLFGRATEAEQTWLRASSPARSARARSTPRAGGGRAGGGGARCSPYAAPRCWPDARRAAAGAAFERRGGARRDRARGRPARACRCSPPARPTSRRRWPRPSPAGRGRDRRQARRHPDPGPPRRRRGARRDPQPRRHHRPAARGGRGRARAARPSGSSSTARRSRSAETAAAAVPGDGPRTAQSTGAAVAPYFFDLLHVDGRDLLDSPGHERLAALDALVPEQHRVRRLVTDDAAAARRVRDRDRSPAATRASCVKDLTAPYDAGRRGSAWVKVKPRPHPRPRRPRRRVGQRPARRAGCPTSTSARATTRRPAGS